MELKVTKSSKLKSNELEISVEAESSVSDKAYSLALKDISNSLDIPGFRKGNAPREIIEKKVGVGYISQKAFEKIFYEMLIDIATQEKLDIVDIIEISSFELLPAKPLKFKFTAELKPEIKLGKYKGLKIKAQKVIYDEKIFIDKTLKKICNNLVTFKKIDNREVQEGDLVTIDFDGKFDDGNPVPGGKAENFQAILEKDKFLPEFVEKLKGAKTQETRQINVTFPDNYSKDFSGKNAKFNVKVLAIEEKLTPEINDELAVKLGMESLDNLKSKISTQMIHLQNQNSDREFENKVVDQIIKNSTFEVSERMIQKEIDYVLNDIKLQCEKNSVKWADFKSNEKNKELFSKAREASIKRISIDLVLSAIIKAENISASKDEIDNQVKSKVTELGEKYKYLESDPKFRGSVELVVLRNKSVDFLLKNNEPIWDEKLTKIIPE